jgi:hypothetical protein
MNLQVEVPPTLTAALDLIAANARGGEGVTRSHLIRSVLTEYVELKLGPNFRQALQAHERFGGDVLAEFVKQAITATGAPKVPQVDVLADAGRHQGAPLGEYHQAPEHEASAEDADPVTAAPQVDAEQFKTEHPFEPLPEHFPVKTPAWKPFI